MEDTIRKWLSFSITGISTLGSWKGLFNNDLIHKNSQGIYGLCKQEPHENEIIYAVFRHIEELEDILEKKIEKETFFIDKLYVGDSIVYKLDKSYWLSQEAWERMMFSDYSQITKEDPNESDLLYHIKYNTEKLRQTMSDYLKCPIRERNIYWKVFNKEEETLDLSIINDLSMMQYRKQDLLTQMKKDPYQKSAYEWVLNNSVEVSDVQDSVNKSDLESMFIRLQDYLYDIEGSKQVQLVFGGDKKWPLMPNKIDFCNNLNKIIKKYKPKDIKRIEECLKNHLNPENRGMQLKYYIMKNGESTLMTDYESYEKPSTNRLTLDV